MHFRSEKNGVLLDREGLHTAVGPFVAADDAEVRVIPLDFLAIRRLNIRRKGEVVQHLLHTAEHGLDLTGCKFS